MKRDRKSETCLLCDKSVHQRGLCVGHYMAAQRTLKSAEADGMRQACDAEMVRRGQLAPAKHGPAAKLNPFMETLEAVRRSLSGGEMTGSFPRAMPRCA